MNNKCIKCGKELPEGASFCPYCANSQVVKHSAPVARPWKKKLFILLIVILLAAILAFGMYIKFGPKTYEGGASVVYTDDDGEIYNVYLKFFGDGPKDKFVPDEKHYFSLTPDEITTADSRLYVSQNMSFSVSEKFYSQVKNIQVDSLPHDDAEPLVFQMVEYTALAPNALISAEYFYTTKNKTNDIRWTITMKNGDKIILTHTITIEEVPLVRIYPEDEPMNTIEELQALFDKLEKEYTPNTSISIYLPPVTYEGGFSYHTRVYNLCGSREGDAITTFTGDVSVSTRSPTLAHFDTICFKGNGTDSIGFTLTSAAIFDNCVFEDHDIALNVLDGGWAIVDKCTFERNNIGFESNNPGDANASSNTFGYCIFKENNIALSLKHIPFTDTFTFYNAKFINNTTDIINYTDCTMDVSEAIFE